MAEIGNVTVRVDAVITDEQYREAMSAVRAANERMDLLEAENAKLREEVEQWHRLTVGIELPDYPITEFKPKDLERENAKLRVLCRDMYLVVELLDMDGMRLQAHGKDADWRTLRERFEELMGIEVDG